MTAPTEDLIARLEDYAQNGFAHPVADALMLDAAADLRQLQEELDRWKRLADLWVPKPYCPPAVSSSARSALTGSAD